MGKRTSGGQPVAEPDDQPGGVHSPVAGESNARAVRHPAKPDGDAGVRVPQLPQRDAKAAGTAEDAGAGATTTWSATGQAPPPTGQPAAPAAPAKAPKKRRVGKHKS